MRHALMLTDVSGREAVYCSKIAEEGKLEGIWIPEMTRRDSVSILGAVAVTTETIHIATGILNVFSRTPALITMTLMTLQELSGGRLIGGLSVGNPAYTRNIHGMQASHGVLRLSEAIQIIKAISGDHPFQFKGRILQIENWNPNFPRLKPIPIYVGAHNPALLKLIGELADGVILNLVSPDDVRRAVGIIQESARQHDRDPNSIDIAAIMMLALNKNRSQAEWRIRKQIAFYLSRSRLVRERFKGGVFADDINRLEKIIGGKTLEQVAEILPQHLVDALSIYGDQEDLKTKLVEYEKAGLNLSIAYVAGWLGDSCTFTESLVPRLAL